MIDTVKLYFHMTELVQDRLNDLMDGNRHDVKLYRNALYVKHPFGYKNPKVMFNIDKRELRIESSLPKLLQGHNVFGSNHLQLLCLAVIRIIYRQLGLRFTTAESNQIEFHRVRLGRLDVGCSFRMESQEDVATTIEECWVQLRAEGRKWAGHGKDGFETVYNQKNSTRVSEKFYNKYAELLAKESNFARGVAERNLIMDYAECLLRYEVTYRAEELGRLGLEYADQWSVDLVKGKILERLSWLNLEGAIKHTLSPKRLEGLNKGAQTFYALWTQGSDLRPHRHYCVLKRARQSLLRQGIDIYRRPEAGSEIALNEVLIEENAYFVAPRALTRRGAIFGF